MNTGDARNPANIRYVDKNGTLHSVSTWEPIKIEDIYGRIFVVTRYGDLFEEPRG